MTLERSNFVNYSGPTSKKKTKNYSGPLAYLSRGFRLAKIKLI